MIRAYPALYYTAATALAVACIAAATKQVFPRLALPVASLIALNIVTFCLFGCDKLLSGTKIVRVPESVLIAAVIFGGTLSAILAMWLFHHKVSKAKFHRKFIAATVIQIFLILLCLHQSIIDL